MNIRLCLRAALFILAGGSAAAQVVLNEVMYHPPEDRDELQYIELHNAGSAPVSLDGWTLRKGAKFTFPKGAQLAAGAYAVLCRDRAAFTQHYGAEVPVLGEFSGHLKHGGEKLELEDAAGTLVDAVKYTDHAPWPLAADGESASLERICPGAPGTLAENWTSSRLPPTVRPAGTPGRRNDAFAGNLPPVVRDVVFTNAVPEQPTPVTATVEDADGVESVTLRYRVIDADPKVAEQSLPMARTGGDGKSGTYAASLPAQPAGRLIRFQVEARDTAGGIRRFPASHELRPTLSTFVAVNTNTASIGFFQLRQLGQREHAGSSFFHSPGGASPAEPTAPNAALLYLPADGGAPVTFDYVHLVPRQGGWKVHLNKFQPFDGMTTVNVIFEPGRRWALSEALAYEVYRACDVPAPKSGHLRVWLDGRLIGYHLMVEQPNKTFLREHGFDPAGNLYKLLWYGQGLTGQHEKKTNPRTGHADLKKLVADLKSTANDPNAQWELIRQQFAVDEFINYYAVNMCIQNWDGFFNNYFTYHEPKPDGKWYIFPWDEDKTWGDYSPAENQPDSYPWVSLPLTFGMKGDHEPTGPGLPHESHPWGSVAWWRPPGWFSGPLLANPQFRQRFLARLKVINDTIFTEEKFLPVISAMERRLQNEVRLRAAAEGEDAKARVIEFRGHMDSFRQQVKGRHEFIAQELAKAGVK
ncbi:MAG TPA: CotH kinase family protein [Candidatus Limnocylindria bacterium]|jgi:hypothetical protein|nr:CotH kinase family protein [Candidatus Limnocylindria bacterium]